jgi:serine phosphatase RsbU (regulator of sigma subunit)
LAHIRDRWQFWLLLISIVIFVATCVINLSQRREYDLSFSDSDGTVRIVVVAPPDSLQMSEIHTGDKCLSIDGLEIENKAHAEWLVKNYTESDDLQVKVESRGSIISTSVSSQNKYSPLHTLLIVLLGGFFIFTGILLWWHARGESTARSFSLLMTSIGMAFLLTDYINVYNIPLLHYSYSFLWIATYVLIPGALLEFTQRFLKFKIIPLKGSFSYFIFYLPSIILILLLCHAYFNWNITSSYEWASLWRFYFYDFVDAYLIISFTLYAIFLTGRFISSKDSAERQRLQWTILTTTVGVLPFFILYKIPIFLGYQPIVPLWICQSIMLIVPIGWGMSVSSFRMFEVEWVLSRTIIYVIAAIIVVYILTLFAIISTNYYENNDIISLILLVMIVIITIYIAITGLISQISRIVDRLYYRDYYDYHEEVQKISKSLSKTAEKSKIVYLLTDELPKTLQIDKATLVTIQNPTDYCVENSSMHLSNGEKTEVLSAVEGAIENSSGEDETLVEFDSKDLRRGYGYCYLLKLGSAEQLAGVLMLGAKISGAPLSIQDRRLLIGMSTQVAITLENIRMQQELIRTELIKQDLNSAARIMSLIVPQPDQLPDIVGVDLHGYSYPCHEIGGDYLDVIETQDRRVAFIISDVSGKGLQASLLVSNLQATCQVLFHSGLPLPEIMGEINRILFNNSTPEQYVTCFAGILDPGNGELETVNAGHNDPYLVHSDGQIEPFQERNLILGIMENVEFTSTRVLLSPGDTVYLYTDGISEAFSPDGSEFGEARLMRILKEMAGSSTCENLLRRIESDVAQWCDVSNPANGFPHDDFTQLCLKYRVMT